MRERYHAQPRTHSFCAHAHEKQGCVMNHLRRKIVEQVNDQGMRGKGASTDKRDRQKERIKRLWGQVKSVIERGKWTKVQSGKKKETEKLI